MLPFENSPDLLFHTCPSFPLTTMFKVRPYKTVDKDAVYKVCLETCEDGADGQTTYCDSPDVLPDKLVGPFLTYCAENCFVIVDDRNEICGYILTAPDAATFFDNIASQWMPLMMQKYPFHEKTEETNPVKEASSAFHAPFKPLTAPAEWYQSYVHISINARGRDCISGDPCAVKRAFTCAVTTLKILGSRGVFTKVDLQHRNTVQLYKTLGFTELPSSSNSSNEDVILLGRVI